MRTSRPQHTLGSSVTLSGTGLFHGAAVNMTLHPADEGTGRVFRRIDLPGRPAIAAHISNVTKAVRRTVLANEDGASVETVEHIMSALAALQVDNCVIDLDAVETPSFDGSASEFCNAILSAGIVRQSAPAAIHTIGELRRIGQNSMSEQATVRPSLLPLLAVTYHLTYGRRSPVKAQMRSFEVSPQAYLREIAAARTFVLESEIEALQAAGYGRHLTADDIVVVNQDGSIRDNELRWPDEYVRHKILDCIGDLALAGAEIHGHVASWRGGHRMNHRVASHLAESQGDANMAAA